MGTMTTLGIVDAIGEGIAGLEQGLVLHLTGNFFPPLPAAYATPLIEAINKVNEEDYDALIELPQGIYPLPRKAVQNSEGVFTVSARDLLEVCRAWEFTSL